MLFLHFGLIILERTCIMLQDAGLSRDANINHVLKKDRHIKLHGQW